MNINILDGEFVSEIESAIKERIQTIKNNSNEDRKNFVYSIEHIKTKSKKITEQELFDYLYLERIYGQFNHIASLSKVLTRTNKDILPHKTIEDNFELKNFITKTFNEIESYEDKYLNLELKFYLAYKENENIFFLVPRDLVNENKR
jgi:hypothetical protein